MQKRGLGFGASSLSYSMGTEGPKSGLKKGTVKLSALLVSVQSCTCPKTLCFTTCCLAVSVEKHLYKASTLTLVIFTKGTVD